MILVYANQFHNRLRLARNNSPIIKKMVHLYEIKDYNKMDCYLSRCGNYGYAINNGELVSVFSRMKNKGNVIMMDAIQNGAIKLDCFDGYLVSFYKKHGFTEIKREKNWDNGQPDIVYMKRNKIKITVV